MKKIIIELSEEQYSKMEQHFQKRTTLNVNHETFSEYGFNLKCVEDGIYSGLKWK